MTDINLKIVNNTATELPISILGVINNPQSFNNINTSYDFDFTGQTLDTNLYFTYSTITAPLTDIEIAFPPTTPTLQSYVDLLNTLNVGYFTLSGNIIYMFSNDFIGRLLRTVP
jgi:hypothetical protein